MSVVYNLSSKVANYIKNLIRKSLFFSIIFSIFYFIEKEWVNSFFKGLYPSENVYKKINPFKKGILSKISNLLPKHIFSPILVIIAFSVFMILSLNPISSSLQINIAIGFLFFSIGCFIIPKYFFNDLKMGKTSPISSWKEKIISFNSKDIYAFGFCLILISLVFFVLSVVSVGGLPLLKPSLRYSLKPLFTMPVFLIIPGVALIGAYVIDEFKNIKISRSQARFRIMTLVAISSAILLSLGYRTHIIAVLLIMVIISYYGKVLAIWEVILAILLSVGLIVGIGYYRSLSELAITSNLSPIYTLQSRADFTLHVLDLLNYISTPFGLTHGSLTLSSLPGSELGPRATIGQLIAWRSEVTVTPTLIGPMLVDFGVIGVGGGMGLIGFILGVGYKILQKTNDPTYIAIYGILLSYTLLGVETGILDITVIIYFILALIIYVGSIYKSFKFNKNTNR